MFGAPIRVAEQCHSVNFTEFGRWQMAAVREEPDREYEAAISLNAKPSKDEAHAKISSNSRT